MTGPIPDPLRRFVATPHVAVVSHEDGELCIASNDLGFTQELFAYFRDSPANVSLRAIEHIKLIVEHFLPHDGEDLTRLNAGSLGVVLRGTNTIMIHDSESREVLGFVAQGVSCQEVVQRLLPAVVVTNG